MFIYTYLILLGLCLGSFIYNTALRIQTNQSILIPSHCENCKKKINFLGLIPLIGFIVFRGRCQNCQEKISWQYPFWEIMSAFLVLFIYSKTGMSYELFYQILLFETFLLIAILDFQTHFIFSYPVIFAFFIQTVWLFFNPLNRLDHLLGMLIGAGVFHFVAYFYQALRGKSGLGEGDATILGLIGYCLGWKCIIPIVFYSSFFGLIGGSLLLLYRHKSLRHEIAFGPWLILAAFIYWHYPNQIIELFNFFK